MADDTPDVPPPTVRTDRLGDGWERVEASVDRLFDAGGVDVWGHTLVFEDTALRAAVREATDGAVDQSWRFFFATRLRFRPPLAPGVGLAMVLPTVKSEAVRSFVADLRGRGIEDLDRGRTERVRTGSGDRVRMRQLTGRVDLADSAADLAAADTAAADTVAADGRSVLIEGWVGAWTDGAIYLAGGAYPTARLDAVFGVEDDSSPLARSREHYRSSFFDLVRAVGE